MTPHEAYRRYERYFRDPKVGDDFMKPPMPGKSPISGVACENIRLALKCLGYKIKDGDAYDEELAKAVERFQIERKHKSYDGRFGPGTRELLIQEMIKKSGPTIFKRELITEIRILFLAADPINASRIRLLREEKEIRAQIQVAKLQPRFTFHDEPSVGPTDIIKKFIEVQPQIVHFAGHGTSAGELAFENHSGEAHLVKPYALAALFKKFAHVVDCVVLNACHSSVLAAAIATHIDHVIGMSSDISDDAAIAFSIGFYQALGAGSKIEEAYSLGCTQMALLGFPEDLNPVLLP